MSEKNEVNKLYQQFVDNDYEVEPLAGSVSRARSFWTKLDFKSILEVFLIFAVFAAYGSWPVPDVNEQYYVGKAIHFWNNDWLGNDPFLNTPDSHWLFYAVFGLLSFVFKQNALVWVGRVLVWLATAFAWRRLSRAFFPGRWLAVFTAAAFAFYLETFHLAGEWIFGGVEGKGLAFPFVFWGLACFVEGKYNRAWILYGIASAFHILVGGWAVLASAFAWTFDAFRLTLSANPGGFGAKTRFLLRKAANTLPGLCVGGAISLLGLIPALKLDLGATAKEIALSRQIYVFERLSHHLVASSLPWTFLVRFSALIVVFVALVFIAKRLGTIVRSKIGDGDRSRVPLQNSVCLETNSNSQTDGGFESRESRAKFDSIARRYVNDPGSIFFRLYAFVVASILFACVGATIDWGARALDSLDVIKDYKASASLLRYYWYRLSDWAVPFGLVVASTRAAMLTLWMIRVNRNERDNLYSRPRLGGALTWIAVGLVCYFAVRFAFYRVAVSAAQANAVDGLIPLPKPTESASFMVAVAFFALTTRLTLSAIFNSRKSEPRLKTNVDGRRVPTNLCVLLLLILVAAPAWKLAFYVDLRGTKVIPRSAPPKESIADGWLDACRWVRENTPKDAVFLVPRGCDSFKWEAQRAEAGSWKEIPQDARSIVRWNRKMARFYANPGSEPDSPTRWNQPLVGVFINKGRARALAEAERYGYQYAIVEAPPYIVATIPEALERWNEFEKNDLVYQNSQFYVLKLVKDDRGKTEGNEQKKADKSSSKEE